MTNSASAEVSNGGLHGENNPVFTLEFDREYSMENNNYQKNSRNGDMVLNGASKSVGKVEVMHPDFDSSSDQCGYGSCEPNWLQVLHNPKCLLACLSLCTIVQGFVCNGLVPVSITTLERRFHLNSTQSGLFSSMYDIAVMIIVIPVCHFGNKGHKGRWLGWGMFIFGIGSFVCIIPQLATSRYIYGDSNVKDTCSLDETAIGDSVTDCSSGGSSLRMYLFVLLLGQLLHGFGASPLYTLGITYLDENVSQKASPVYLGLYIASSTIGPAMGFLIGGLFLQIYGDVGKISDVAEAVKDLDGSNDPRWYGAWWIGFLLASLMAIVFCIPVLSFGRELPGAATHRLKDVDQANQIGGGASIQPGFGTSFRDLPKSCWLLIKNPTWTSLLVMQISEGFLLNGFITFVPKLMENVFALSSSRASMITGAIVVPGGFIGNVLGGYLIRRFSLKLSGILKLAISVNIISFGLVFAFLIYCPEAGFAGVNRAYRGDEQKEFVRSSADQLVAECNRNCSCSSYYTPVCFKSGDFQMSYYSPCMAGCTAESSKNPDGRKTWNSCGCTASYVESEDGGTLLNHSFSVTSGLCVEGCTYKFYLFLALFAVLCLATFTATIPVQQGVLRCVPFSQRTIAMGLSWVFIRLLGSIPGAILFGLAIDKTCTLWKMECGVEQSCVRYSSQKFAYVILGFGVGFKLLNIISLSIGWKFYRPPPKTDTKDIPGPSSRGIPVINGNLNGSKVAPIEENYAMAKF